jgi:rubredoxin
MTYAFYQSVKHGKSPKLAPTHIEDEKPSVKEEGKNKYKCSICGYIYDEAEGDPDGGIKPGTGFEDLPDDWTCPICGAGKEEFEKI